MRNLPRRVLVVLGLVLAAAAVPGAASASQDWRDDYWRARSEVRRQVREALREARWAIRDAQRDAHHARRDALREAERIRRDVYRSVQRERWHDHGHWRY